MSRRSKFTNEVVETIQRAIECGNLRGTAARIAGVNPTTFSRWMRQGTEEPDGPYGAFREMVYVAEATRESGLVGVIFDAAKEGDWKAASWLLACTGGQRWRPKDREKVDEMTASELVSGLTADQRQQVAAQIAAGEQVTLDELARVRDGGGR